MAELSGKYAELRNQALIDHKSIPPESYSADIVSEGDPPTALTKHGANIPATALSCEVANHLYGHPGSLSPAYLHTLLMAVAKMPAGLNAEGDSAHYSEYLWNDVLFWIAAAGALGWNDTVIALRAWMVGTLAIAAPSIGRTISGTIPPSEDIQGPIVLHLTQPPGKGAWGLGAALCGPRGERWNAKFDGWLFLSDSGPGRIFRSIVTGAINPDKSSLQHRLSAAGYESRFVDVTTGGIFAAAILNDSAESWVALWDLAQPYLPTNLHLTTSRRTDGLFSRCLKSAGGSVMKGPRPFHIIFHATGGATWAKETILAGTGNQNWLAFETSESTAGTQGTVKFGNGDVLKAPLPTGKELVRITHDGPTTTAVFGGVPYLPPAERAEIPSPSPAPQPAPAPKPKKENRWTSWL